jgi:hypothetical protein
VVHTHGLLSDLIPGLAFVLGGAYFVFHPKAVIRWIVRHNPHRIFPPDAEERDLWVLRGFFILVIAFGGFLIYVNLSRRP